MNLSKCHNAVAARGSELIDICSECCKRCETYEPCPLCDEPLPHEHVEEEPASYKLAEFKKKCIKAIKRLPSVITEGRGSLFLQRLNDKSIFRSDAIKAIEDIEI